MDWLRGLRRSRLPNGEADEETEDSGGSRTRSSPGVAALFHRLREDGSHVILDLGPAAETHLRIFRRYARKFRFAGLLPTPPRGAALVEALRALPPHPSQPYDAVFAWNILDLLEERERTFVVDRLGALTASGSTLYVVTGNPDDARGRAIQFTLQDAKTVSERRVGSMEPGGRELLPARMERVLAPFEVVRGFTLRHGLREYLAVKEDST